MTDHNIIPFIDSDYSDLLVIWESAARSTHHFLSDEDIAFYKPIVLDAFSQVSLYTLQNCDGNTVGFIGLSNDTIEMLFIQPEHQGKGLGKSLLDFAINKKGIRKVDVNEQNTVAKLFYEKAGFHTIMRSETDPYGKPYPTLHMELLQA